MGVASCVPGENIIDGLNTLMLNKFLSQNIYSYFGFSIRVVQLLLLCTATATAIADSNTPKLVYLIVDENKLIASNIEFNRFDELKLRAKEMVIQQSVGSAVAVVVTNQRIIAYSVFTASWKTKSVKADEKVQNVEAEDYSALVVTSKRFLSFNGKTAVWAETSRSTIFQ